MSTLKTSPQSDPNDIRTELDNHADTSVVSPSAALIFHDFERPVNISGYDGSVGSTQAQVVIAAVAYDCPATGDTYMLVVHQAVAVPSMQHILLSSMQLRDNDVCVNDEPKYLAPNPSQEHHSITIPEANNVPALHIPLRINGVTSYFPTRQPTKEEYKKCTLRLELTAESPEWYPQSMRFREQEDAMLDTRGNIRKEYIQNRNDKIIATVGTNTPASSDQTVTEDQQLATALVAAVHIPSGTIGTVKTGKRKCVVGPLTLAKNWGIGLDAA